MIDQRTMARLAAVQALYAAQINGDAQPDTKHLLDANKQKRMNKKIFEAIMAAVNENAAEVDELIEKNLSDEWKMERVEKTLKAILRAAIAEIKFSDVEKNLVISEYVKITDSFYEGDEPKFVNALLDKIA